MAVAYNGNAGRNMTGAMGQLAATADKVGKYLVVDYHFLVQKKSTQNRVLSIRLEIVFIDGPWLWLPRFAEALQRI